MIKSLVQQLEFVTSSMEFWRCKIVIIIQCGRLSHSAGFRAHFNRVYLRTYLLLQIYSHLCQVLASETRALS